MSFDALSLSFLISSKVLSCNFMSSVCVLGAQFPPVPCEGSFLVLQLHRKQVQLGQKKNIAILVKYTNKLIIILPKVPPGGNIYLQLGSISGYCFGPVFFCVSARYPNKVTRPYTQQYQSHKFGKGRNKINFQLKKSNKQTDQPTKQPTNQATNQPTNQPTDQPTINLRVACM